MKQLITKFIQNYICEYENRDDIKTIWGEPIVGFADANHPYIQNLPTLIRSTHGLPQEVLSDAKIIICYYVPFTKDLARTNQTESIFASEQWALAYEETNAMFACLNQALSDLIATHGYQAKVASQSATYDQTELVSDWSYRHFAYAAGLGTFGINNMLLTRHGCCGRYNTLVTNLDIEADQPLAEDLCLYKTRGTCGICVKNCPGKALSFDGYDRQKCYPVLKENAKVFTEFGSSYSDDSGQANSVGSEVCGKCITSSPCAFWKR